MQLCFLLFSGSKLTQKFIRSVRISSFYIVNMLISNQVTNCNWIQVFLTLGWSSVVFALWLPIEKKLKLQLATLIWKVTDSQKIYLCVKSANFNLNFLSHFCINFENLCAHQQEEILTIPKHPQKSSFWWVLAKKTAKNEVAQKLPF